MRSYRCLSVTLFSLLAALAASPRALAEEPSTTTPRAVEPPATSRDDGRLGREILYTLAGDAAAVAVLLAVAVPLSDGCRSLGCTGGTLAGGLLAMPVMLLVTPAMTNLGGDRRGSYWAAFGGGLLGLWLGGAAAGQVGERLKGVDSSVEIALGLTAGVTLHVASTVFFYELSVDDDEPAPRETGFSLRVAPALTSDYQGALLQGAF